MKKLILLFMTGIIVTGAMEFNFAGSTSAATSPPTTKSTTALKTVKVTGAVKSLRMAASVVAANKAQYKTIVTKPKISAEAKSVTQNKAAKANTKKSETTKPVTVSRGSKRLSVEQTVKNVGSEYWSDPAQLEALMWICKHESTRPGVVSRTGCKGLFQLKYPPKWMVLGNAASEAKAGCEYIKRRYRTPLKAKAFWLKHRWY